MMRVGEDGVHKYPSGAILGYHMLLLASKGVVGMYGNDVWVYDENSWGLGHGHQGMHRMNEASHTKTCVELWSIEE